MKSRPDHQLETPRAAYDRIASRIDRWVWSDFWKIHEAPMVDRWIDSLRTGVACDIGCGTGGYLSRMSRNATLTLGVDISVEMLGIARQRAPKARLAQASADALPLASGRCGAVLCARVLSHVQSIELAAREFARICAPGAALMLTDVHPDHPYAFTRVAVDQEEAHITTYHHSLLALRAVLAVAGFNVASVSEFRRSQLRTAPDPNAFAKLYTGDPPIFYSLVAERSTRVQDDERRHVDRSMEQAVLLGLKA